VHEVGEPHWQGLLKGGGVAASESGSFNGGMSKVRGKTMRKGDRGREARDQCDKSPPKFLEMTSAIALAQ
jgi:hypothetical protein